MNERLKRREQYKQDRPDLRRFVPPYSDMTWEELRKTKVGREYIEEKKESKRRCFQKLGEVASKGRPC